MVASSMYARNAAVIYRVQSLLRIGDWTLCRLSCTKTATTRDLHDNKTNDTSCKRHQSSLGDLNSRSRATGGSSSEHAHTGDDTGRSGRDVGQTLDVSVADGRHQSELGQRVGDLRLRGRDRAGRLGGKGGGQYRTSALGLMSRQRALNQARSRLGGRGCFGALRLRAREARGDTESAGEDDPIGAGGDSVRAP